MATDNFYPTPSDGWVKVTAAGVNFIKIRSNTPNHAFFVTSSGSDPDLSVIGYKVDCEEFWCDVAVAESFYVRVTNEQPVRTRIDVFFIASP